MLRTHGCGGQDGKGRYRALGGRATRTASCYAQFRNGVQIVDALWTGDDVPFCEITWQTNEGNKDKTKAAKGQNAERQQQKAKSKYSKKRKATKQRSNEATKQRSNEATNEATNERTNEKRKRKRKRKPKERKERTENPKRTSQLNTKSLYCPLLPPALTISHLHCITAPPPL